MQQRAYDLSRPAAALLEDQAHVWKCHDAPSVWPNFSRPNSLHLSLSCPQLLSLLDNLWPSQETRKEPANQHVKQKLNWLMAAALLQPFQCPCAEAVARVSSSLLLRQPGRLGGRRLPAWLWWWCNRTRSVIRWPALPDTALHSPPPVYHSFHFPLLPLLRRQKVMTTHPGFLFQLYITALLWTIPLR